MELWFFYAIIGSISIGINGYLVKLLADKKVDGSILTFLQGMAYLVFWSFGILVGGEDFFSVKESLPLILSVVIACIIFFNLRLRIRALVYLSSSEYYIGYRISMTLGLVIIGIIFLGESVTSSQLFWLMLWSVAILFLFEDDAKLRTSRNWGRSLFFLFGSVIAGICIQVIGKMQGLSSLPISVMLFFQGITMLFITGLFDFSAIRKFCGTSKEAIFSILIVAIPATICVYISAVFNLLTYNAGWNVSVVTKIYAYSLFVPIILSILFSGEKVTYKKVIAFFLTVISLYYLV